MTQSSTKFDLKFLVLESIDGAIVGLAMMQFGTKFDFRFLLIESSDGTVGLEEAMAPKIIIKKKKKTLMYEEGIQFYLKIRFQLTQLIKFLIIE